jgi:hypothetical protein
MNQREAAAARLLNWSMPVFMLVFGVFWGILAQNIPPLPPSVSAADLADFYRTNAAALKLAYGISAAATALWPAWSVALFLVMRRMEGPTPVWAYLQLVCGSLTGAVLFSSTMFWLGAAFRPETDPAIIQMLNDLAWLCIDMGFGVTLLHFLSCSIVFLEDKRSKPLVPAWLAWAGIAIGSAYILEIAMPFVRSGPFSWSGFFNYWLPFFGSFAWMSAASFYIFKAIGRLETEEAGASPP